MKEVEAKRKETKRQVAGAMERARLPLEQAGKRRRGKRGGKSDFLELPLLVPLAWLDSGYVFMRQSSRLFFCVKLGSTVDTCTCFSFGNFLEEFHTTSMKDPVFSEPPGIWQSPVRCLQEN